MQSPEHPCHQTAKVAAALRTAASLQQAILRPKHWQPLQARVPADTPQHDHSLAHLNLQPQPCHSTLRHGIATAGEVSHTRAILKGTPSLARRSWCWQRHASALAGCGYRCSSASSSTSYAASAVGRPVGSKLKHCSSTAITLGTMLRTSSGMSAARKLFFS
jgi:hypothetical protein